MKTKQEIEQEIKILKKQKEQSETFSLETTLTDTINALEWVLK